MNKAINKLLKSGKLLPQTFKKLKRLTSTEINSILGLIDALQLGINYNHEFIEYLCDICRRDNIRVNTILNSAAIKKILNAKNLPRGSPREAGKAGLPRDSKIREIRRVLRRLRFPVMTAYEGRGDA